MNKGINRFEQKKRHTHALILEKAASLIREEGFTSFSLEKIADTANISRATLFNHIHGRDELIAEALVPFFDECVALLESLLPVAKDDPLDAIGQACRYLWQEHRGLFGRESCMNTIDQIPALHVLHDKIMSLFTSLFETLPRVLDIRFAHPHEAAPLVFRTFIPILDSLADSDDIAAGFRSCLVGLIAKAP